MDLAAFADGALKGYSVTSEVFENRDVARQLAVSAWEQISRWDRSRFRTSARFLQQIEASQAEPAQGAARLRSRKGAGR